MFEQDYLHLRLISSQILIMLEQCRFLQVYYGLSNITNPVLIIAGDQDSVLPVQYDIKAASMIPNASLIQWPDAGHSSVEQHCLSSAAIINSWLDDNE